MQRFLNFKIHKMETLSLEMDEKINTIYSKYNKDTKHFC